MKKTIGVITLVFITALIFLSVLFFGFFGIFVEFNLISDVERFYYLGMASLLGAIIAVLIKIALVRIKKKTKFENWLSANLSKFILAYILGNIFLLSIKAELIWSLEEMKETLILAWCIFGISITVFLVWNAVVIKYLGEKRPSAPVRNLPTSRLRYIEEKSIFHTTASIMLGSANLLLANLGLLSFATVAVFVSLHKATVFNQSIIMAVLILCTNTILTLVLDILRPFNENRKTLLKETRVTDADVLLQNSIEERIERSLEKINSIGRRLDITKDERNILISEELEFYTKELADEKPYIKEEK